ncbi:MAG: C-GCAxxG-C-C family protein [Clostridiales bacterium]|nr:C-GCAxxG-C-C family protein [Clostridiales bacterium]
MENKAYGYYKEGYNCSACILKAAEDYFKMPIDEQCYSLCSGVNMGMGVGSTCSALVAAVMVFGLMFDKETVKRLRIKLFSDFSENHKDLSCPRLAKGPGCGGLIKEVAALAKAIIEEELRWG